MAGPKKRETPPSAPDAATKKTTVPTASRSHSLRQLPVLIGLLIAVSSIAQCALAVIYGDLLASRAVSSVTFISIAGVDIYRMITESFLKSNPRRILAPVLCLTPLIFALAPIKTGLRGRPREFNYAFTFLPALAMTTWCVLDTLQARTKLGQSRPGRLLMSTGLFLLIALARPLFTDLLRLALSVTSSGTLLPAQLLLAFLSMVTTPDCRKPGAVTLVVVALLLFRNTPGPQLSISNVNRHLDSMSESPDWSVLDRKFSNTGYISVLENKTPGYRVLRCDHSFLGGEWISAEAAKVGEPIYAVFALLESVRLIARPEPHTEKSALVIGLGAGSAPKGLIQHGLDTTIVEIDPVVYHYAQSYFDLPENHTAVIEDAVSWTTAQLKSPSPKRYDYIIHDVFTGGTEPLQLFTQSFLTNLRNLMAPNGAIAINYAGDTRKPLTRDVLFTIRSVFGNSCRAFRDMDPSQSTEKAVNAEDAAYANIVIFCTYDPKSASLKTSGGGGGGQSQLFFRSATEGDYLGSESRRQFLKPDAALELVFPDADANSDASGVSLQVLTEARIGGYKTQLLASSRRHWGFMRGTVPGYVWETY